MTLDELVQALEEVNALVCNMPDTAVIVFDQDRGFRFLSGPALESSGYPRKTFLQATLRQASNVEGVRALQPLYDRVLDGEEVTIDFRGTNHVDYRAHSYPIVDNAHVEGGVLLIVRAATQALELYRQILTASPGGVALFTAEGNCRRANAVALEGAGDTLEQAPEQSPRELLPGFSGNATWQQCVEDLTEPDSNKTLQCRHGPEDSESRHSEVSPSHLSLSGHEGVVAVSRDVSESVERQARLRRVIDATSDGIWDWNIQTDETYFSPRWNEILGFAVGEVPPHASWFFDRVHPDDRERVQLAATQQFENDGPLHMEIRVRHKDGSYRDILSRGDGVRDASGRVVRITGAITDITERKVAEKALQQHAKMQEVLLREINHRVRNNLATLRAIVGAELDRARRDPREAATVLGNLDHRIRAISIAHDVLSEHHWRPVRLTTLCERVVSATVQGHETIGPRIEIAVARSPAIATAQEAHHVALVLAELTTNTLKHGRSQGGGVRIEVDIQCDGEQRMLNFRDHGVGYPDEIVSGTRACDQLGLELLHGIVCHSLRGDLELSSDQGAVTAIRLPGAASPRQAPA